MNTWLIEGMDPLIFRGGKPFTAVPGSIALSSALPAPSVVAGAVRTRAGTDEDGRFDTSRIPELEALRIAGPMVAVDEGAGWGWAAPAPADALQLTDPQGDDARPGARVVPLAPLALPDGCATNDPERPLVAPISPSPAKPDRRARPLWRWKQELEPWLIAPATTSLSFDQVDARGLRDPEIEERSHVSLDPETGTAAAGALFGTAGRRWWASPKRPRMAIAALTDASFEASVAPIGGERRMAVWTRADDLPFPEPPSEVIASARAGGVRLLLLTPAFFEGGSPPPLSALGLGPEARLAGVVHGRPLVISGWDMAKRRPKATRRLIPSGAVFFLALGPDADANESWARATWGACFSDDNLDRSGFGLAVLGVWSTATLARLPSALSTESTP